MPRRSASSKAAAQLAHARARKLTGKRRREIASMGGIALKKKRAKEKRAAAENNS